MSKPIRPKSYGASVDVVSINPTGSNMNLGVTLNYDNQEGLSTDVELGFTNNPILQSLGLNMNIGSSGASGSMTQNGGTMGTVDQDGNYEANENFLGEISGHDIAENNGTLNAQNDSDGENDSDNPRESEPQVDGLIPFLIGTGVSLVTAAATAVAGSSTSSGSGRPTSGSSGQNGSVVNPVRPPKKREDGDDTDGSREQSAGDSKRQPTDADLNDFKKIFMITSRAETDRILDQMHKDGIDTTVLREYAQAQRDAGVRDLTPAEVKVKKIEKELSDMEAELKRINQFADNSTLPKSDIRPVLNLFDSIEKKRKELEAARKDAIANDTNAKRIQENLDREAKRLENEAKLQKTKELAFSKFLKYGEVSLSKAEIALIKNDKAMKMEPSLKTDFEKRNEELKSKQTLKINMLSNLSQDMVTKGVLTKEQADRFNRTVAPIIKEINIIRTDNQKINELIQNEVNGIKSDQIGQSLLDDRMTNFDRIIYELKKEGKVDLTDKEVENHYREAIRIYIEGEKVLNTKNNLPVKAERFNNIISEYVTKPISVNGEPNNDISVSSEMGNRYLKAIKQNQNHPAVDFNDLGTNVSIVSGKVIHRTFGTQGYYLTGDGILMEKVIETDLTGEKEAKFKEFEGNKEAKLAELNGATNSLGNSVTVLTSVAGEEFKVTSAHLQSAYRGNLEHIKEGDTLGEVGNTGLSTGLHLHLQVEIVNPLGTNIPKERIHWIDGVPYVDAVYFMNHFLGPHNQYLQAIGNVLKK